MIPNFPELSLFDIVNVDNLILFLELLVFLFVLHKIKTVNDNVNKGLENMKRIDEKFKKELYKYDVRKRSDDDSDHTLEYKDEMLEKEILEEKMIEEERTIRESGLRETRLRPIGFRKRMMLKRFL
jgi:hypothetical protein